MSATPTADARAFRDALGAYATGVALVAIPQPGGGGLAITVNSFASVSLSPPLVLWSIDRASARRPAFAAAARFAVSVLAADQEELARRFASEAALAPGEAGFVFGPSGAPEAEGALAVFECSRQARHDGGDHDIIVGRVHRFAVGAAGPGLLYFRGRYGRAQ